MQDRIGDVLSDTSVLLFGHFELGVVNIDYVTAGACKAFRSFEGPFAFRHLVLPELHAAAFDNELALIAGDFKAVGAPEIHRSW